MSYADWRGRFLEAVDESLYPAAWLDRRVSSGEWRLWESADAAILCSILTYPSGVKEVHGEVAATRHDGIGLEAIEALIPLAEAYGQANGCTRGTIKSSPAWARRMARYGYVIEQVSIVKELAQ